MSGKQSFIDLLTNYNYLTSSMIDNEIEIKTAHD